MNNYKLYINGNEIDLKGDETILITKQRTDYTNPTIIKNSFTKTIKIPGTKTNNKVFNEIWKLDRVQWEDCFNASKRTPFILFKNGFLYEKGYVKLDNISNNNGFYTYDITLYGEMGNILYQLSYKTNDEDFNVEPLTLADLSLGFNSFIINKTLVKNAWNVLKTGEGADFYKTINWCISYDGIPKLNNFDTKKIWTSTTWREVEGGITWKNRYWGKVMPDEITEDGITYKAVPEMVSKMDPQDKYGLMEVKDDLTPLEARDFRSYLLRPVINISRIFAAINTYMQETIGYTLDMSDSFFSTDEFLNSWMTLSMLYDIDENVESNTRITKQQLLGNTGSPASYLISFCKIYGIYLDVDVFEKKLILRRLPNFFTGDVQDLKIDYSKEVKINPLSFDKATYTFDYTAGDGEFLKQYKEIYHNDYGSARVNTGFSFSADTAPYIDNNIYKIAVDTIEQSRYFTYCNPETNNYIPVVLSNPANENKFKLFQYGNGVNSTEDVMSCNLYADTYQFMNENWDGLQQGLFQDAFPKIQLHNADRKSFDGKNVLIRFNGFKSVNYGYATNGSFTHTTTRKVQYLLSDDWYILKHYCGNKNCYFDNPIPDMGSPAGSYLDIIDELPSFSVGEYNMSPDVNKYPLMLRNYSNTAVYGDGAGITKYIYGFTANINPGTGSKFPYITLSDDLFKTDHKYLLVANIRTNNYNNMSGGPWFTNGTVISNTGRLESTSDEQLVMSICVARPYGITRRFAPISVVNPTIGVSFTTTYMLMYDLTELGFDNINTVEEAAEVFNLKSGKNNGYNYNLVKTYNFGNTREIYVPATIVNANSNIFDRYWKHYISDVYSVNTRVVNCYCYLDNNNMTFRRFYYFDGCIWILSKMEDWNSTDKVCKAIFIKVNDKANYME